MLKLNIRNLTKTLLFRALEAICNTGVANISDLDIFAHPEEHVDKHTQQQMELDEIKRADIANAMKKTRLETQNQALAKAAQMGIASELLGGDDLPGLGGNSATDMAGRRNSHLPAGLTGRRESSYGGRRESNAFKSSARKMSLANNFAGGLTASRRMSRKVSLVPSNNLLVEDGTGSKRNSERRKSSVAQRKSRVSRVSRVSKVSNRNAESEENDAFDFKFNVDESEPQRASAVRYTVGGAPEQETSGRTSLSVRNTLTNNGVTTANKSRHMLAQKVTAAIRMSQFSRTGGRQSLLGNSRRMSSSMNLRNINNKILSQSNTQMINPVKEHDDSETTESKENFEGGRRSIGGRKMSLSGIASQVGRGMGRRMSVDSIGIGIRESIKASAHAITGQVLTKDINEAIQNIAQPEKTRSILRNNHSRHRWSELRLGVRQSETGAKLSNVGLRISESKGGLRVSESKGGIRTSESKTNNNNRNFGSTFSFAEEKRIMEEMMEQDENPENDEEEVDEGEDENSGIHYRESQNFEFKDWSAAYLEEKVESESSGSDANDLFKERSLEYDQEEKDKEKG